MQRVIPLILVVLLGGLAMVACGGSPPGTGAASTPTHLVETGAEEISPTSIASDEENEAAPTGSTDADAGAADGGSVPIEVTDVGKVPSGWKVVQEPTKMCQIAVPPGWITGTLEGAAQSPTGSVTALASADEYSNFGGDWQSYKRKSKEFWSDYKAVEDSDKVHHLQGPAGEHLRTSDQGDHACGVLITPTSDEQAQQARSDIAQVLESIGPAK